MHFINIDRRVKKSNGATYVILENGQELLLPPTVNKVPALLLLNKSHHVLFGLDINKHLEANNVVHTNPIVKSNGEPMAYSLSSSGFGVASDNYSFLDQDPQSLSAKGDGGMRQQHTATTRSNNPQHRSCISHTGVQHTQQPSNDRDDIPEDLV
jgi:hypothetical protein